MKLAHGINKLEDNMDEEELAELERIFQQWLMIDAELHAVSQEEQKALLAGMEGDLAEAVKIATRRVMKNPTPYMRRWGDLVTAILAESYAEQERRRPF